MHDVEKGPSSVGLLCEDARQSNKSSVSTLQARLALHVVHISAAEKEALASVMPGRRRMAFR